MHLHWHLAAAVMAVAMAVVSTHVVVVEPSAMQLAARPQRVKPSVTAVHVAPSMHTAPVGVTSPPGVACNVATLHWHLQVVTGGFAVSVVHWQNCASPHVVAAVSSCLHVLPWL